jgi:glycerophosphoryl diester phosphodiesterase
MRSLLLPRLKRTPPDWLTKWTYAHRGLHSDAVPENSLLGARLAIEAGFGIECDIQRSADDHPMVFHDWEFGRLTDGEGGPATSSADEMQKLHYVGSEEHPATLAQLLDLISGKVPLLVEIKSKAGYDIGRSCKIVADALHEYSGEHAVMSFDPRVARWFHRHSRGTLAGLVMREDKQGHTQQAWQRYIALWIAQPDFLAYHIHALPSPMVAALREKGFPILTWTVNSPDLRERASAYADVAIAEGAGIA